MQFSGSNCSQNLRMLSSRHDLELYIKIILLLLLPFELSIASLESTFRFVTVVSFLYLLKDSVNFRLKPGTHEFHHRNMHAKLMLRILLLVHPKFTLAGPKVNFYQILRGGASRFEVWLSPRSLTLKMLLLGILPQTSWPVWPNTGPLFWKALIRPLIRTLMSICSANSRALQHGTGRR